MLFLGCLSPEEMLLSAQIGWYAAAFAIGIVFASVLLSQARNELRDRLSVAAPNRPSSKLDVVSGDCGYAKRFLSGAISLVLVVLLIFQISCHGSYRRFFILTITLLHLLLS